MGSVTWVVTDAGDIIVSRIVDGKIASTNITKRMREYQLLEVRPKDEELRAIFGAICEEMDACENRYEDWRREQSQKHQNQQKCRSVLGNWM